MQILFKVAQFWMPFNSWDFWEFKGGIGKPMTVFMKSPNEEYEDAFAYEGPLRKEFI
jgi:hypothetical protein